MLLYNLQPYKCISSNIAATLYNGMNKASHGRVIVGQCESHDAVPRDWMTEPNIVLSRPKIPFGG